MLRVGLRKSEAWPSHISIGVHTAYLQSIDGTLIHPSFTILKKY